MRSFVVFFLFLCAVCCASCAANVSAYETDYIAARTSAIRGWEEVVGPLSADCLAIIDLYTVIEVEYVGCNTTKLPEGMRYTGCVKHGDIKEIHILNSRTPKEKAKTGIHEFIHVLARCEWQVGDSKHQHPVLWARHDKNNSVEAVACRRHLANWGNQ